MLTKCANPACASQFRYLHQGQLYFGHAAPGDNHHGPTENFAGVIRSVRYVWICDDCRRRMNVVFDRENGFHITARRRREYPSAA